MTAGGKAFQRELFGDQRKTEKKVTKVVVPEKDMEEFGLMTPAKELNPWGLSNIHFLSSWQLVCSLAATEDRVRTQATGCDSVEASCLRDTEELGRGQRKTRSWATPETPVGGSGDSKMVSSFISS